MRRLTTDKADDWDPGYTPDGADSLELETHGNFEIWIPRTTEVARDRSRPMASTPRTPACPDGRWMVYTSANPAHNGIWKIHPD